MQIHDIYRACDDCVSVIASDNGTDDHFAAMVEHCKKRNIDLFHAHVAEPAGFSRFPCQLCGTRLHGNRHDVNVLCDHPDCEPSTNGTHSEA